jgi:hypothetical protein
VAGRGDRARNFGAPFAMILRAGCEKNFAPPIFRAKKIVRFFQIPFDGITQKI